MSSVDEERTALIAKAVNLTRRAQTLLTLHEESGIAYDLNTVLTALESVSPRLVTSEDLPNLEIGTVIVPWCEDKSLPRLLEVIYKNDAVAFRGFNGAHYDHHWYSMIFPASVLWSPAPEGSKK